MRVGIDLATGLEKHTAVAAFESADEENEVVALGKFLHPGQSIRNATANRVVTTELCRRLYVGGEVIDECLEPFERFGGLREEISVAREVDFVHFADVGDHDRLAVGLPHETEHFGVPVFAVNHDLRIFHFVINAANALLQIEHHGAGGIDKRDVVAARNLIS